MANLEGSVEFDDISYKGIEEEDEEEEEDDDDDEEEENEESEGLVHVNAYTREDGTEVREHFRSAPGSGNDGIAEMDKAIEEYTNRQKEIRGKIENIGSYQSPYYYGQARFKPVESRIQDIIKDWERYLEKATAELKKILDRIAKNKDRAEHQKLIVNYVNQKELLFQETEKYNYVKYNFENGKYSDLDVSSEIPQNYVRGLQVLSNGGSPQLTGNFTPQVQNYPIPKIEYHKNMVIQDYDPAKAEFIKRWMDFPRERDIWSGMANVAPFVLPERIVNTEIIDGILGKLVQNLPKTWKEFIKAYPMTRKIFLRDSKGYIRLTGKYNEVYTKKLIALDKVFVDNGYKICEHGLNKTLGRAHSGKLLNIDKIYDVIKNGTRYIDHEGNLTLFKDKVSIHVNKTGEIITIVGKRRIPDKWRKL